MTRRWGTYMFPIQTLQIKKLQRQTAVAAIE